MIKKRIKRALRAIGLVKPHQGAASPARNRLNRSEAQAVVADLYRIVLKREPSLAERDAYSAALTSGLTSVPGVVDALIGSDEFGTAFSRNPAVAQTVSTVVLSGLAQVTDEAAIEAYASGLAGGLPLEEFLREICASSEFRANWGAGSGVPGGLPGSEGGTWRGLSSKPPVTLPGTIGQTIEDLIAARLVGEGAVLGLPPVPMSERPPISYGQLMSLIRTLDMLADRPCG